MSQRKKLTVQPEISESPRKPAGKPKNIKTPLLSEVESLRANEDKFKFMFEHSIAGKSFTLPSGEINVNQAFCDLLGYSREELQNKRWQDISCPEDIELTQRALDKILSGEQDSVRFVKRYLHKTGSVIWADVSTSLHRDETNRPLYLMTEINDITARKQAESALLETQLLLSAVVESTDDFVWSVDPEHFGLLTFNKRLSDNFLKARGIHITTGMTPEDLYPTPDFVETWQSLYRRALLEGSYKTEYVGKTGPHIMECNFSLLKRDRAIIGISVFGRDITARKQAEEELRKSEKQLSVVFNNTSDQQLLYKVESDGELHLINVNDSNIKTVNDLGFDITKKDLIGKTIDEIALSVFGMSQELYNKTLNYFKQAVTTGKPVYYEESVQLEKNLYVSETTLTPVLDEKGTCTYVLHTSHNITGRKLGEIELAESENRYRSLFENASIGIFHSLPEGRFLRANFALARMLGYDSPAEMISLITDIGTQIYVDSQRRTQIVTTTLDQADWVNAENRYRRKDGSILTANLTARKVLNPDGSLAYLEGFVEDITERKRVEKFLKDIIAMNPLSIQVLDEDGFTLEANPAHKLLFGSVPPSDYSIFNDLQLAQKGMGEIFDRLRNGEVVHFPDVNFNPHDSIAEMPDVPAWVRTIGFPLCDSNGKPERFILMHENITGRKQAEEALQASKQSAHQIAEQLQIVNQIGHEIAAGLDFDQLLQTIHEQCKQIGDTDTFYIALYDAATGMLNFPFFYKDGERRSISSRNIRENAGLAGYIVENHRTLYLPDESILPAGATPVRQPGRPTRSFIGIPLILKDQTVGIFSMQSHSLDAYSPEQIKTLELLATQVAIAIKNSQLYAQVENERNLANALIDNIPGAMCLVDLQGHLVRWNKLAETITGYSPDEARNLEFLSLFPEDEHAHLAELVTRVFAGEQVTTEAQLIVRGGAKTIPFFATGTRVLSGNDVNLLVVGIDISERKRAEEALRENESRFRAFIEQSPIAIGVFQLDGITLYANQKFVETLGFQKVEELIGRPAFEFFAPSFREESKERTRRRLQGLPVPAEYESTALRADTGLQFPVHLAVAPIQLPSGTVSIAFLVDNTERKQAELKLKGYSEHLEELVEERTRELRAAQDQLVRQEKLAVLGQIAGSVSHELRNPLGVISNAIYYLKLVQPDADEKIKKYYDMIEREMHNSEKIISDLLNFTRLKSTEREPVSIPELVQRTLERLPVPKTVTVALKLPADLPMVFADPLQVEQLLGNLITNASQAMKDDGNLTISAHLVVPISKRGRKKEMIAIAVMDTGVGIPPENIPKLFDPLFTTKINGIGLGLAISQKLAEANGGQIEVESEPGKGSTFTLYLPLHHNVEEE